MRVANQSRSRQWLIVLSGLLVSCVFIVVYLIQPAYFSLLGLKAYDVMLGSLPADKGFREPLIVDIDEVSLAQFGQWPWPRYRVALLLDKLNQAGARAVALDMLFAEPDRTSLPLLQAEMKRDLEVEFSIQDLPARFRDNDAVLAGTLARGPFVLGYSFLYEENSFSDISPAHPLNVISRSTSAAPLLSPCLEPQGVIVNLPELSQAAPASGFLNALSDCDGVLRRLPLIINLNGRYYPSLALAAVMQAKSADKIILNSFKGKLESLSLARGGLVPLDEKGNLLLYYHGKQGFYEYVAAADVLSDRVAEGKFKDRVVVVGATAAGLHDFQVTPLDSFYPGVEVHATMIDNLLQGKFLRQPVWARGGELVALFGIGIMATLFLAWARPWLSLLFFFGAGCGLWYGSFFLLKVQGFFVNPLYAMALMVVNFIFLTLLKYWREERALVKRNHDLLMAQDTTIISLTAMAETRDDETGGHILRIQNFVRILAEYLASQTKYKKQLDKEMIDLLYRSVPLHDIGKVGVLDRILLKYGKLTAPEFAEMREHPRIGRDILIKAEARLPVDSGGGGRSFLHVARELVYTHHEKWDGSGYPRGLRGENIPLSGRLVALADVYDVLRSRKRYKPALPHVEAAETIRNLRGTHLDPDIVDAFLALEGKFVEIVDRFPDAAEPYDDLTLL